MSVKNNKILYVLIVCIITTSISYGQLSSLNDEFDGATLDASWSLYKTELFETPVPINDGFLEMDLDNTLCSPTCVWYLDDSAGLIYKTVTGDFDVVTAVYSKQQSNPTVDINNDTQLAGIIVRDPASISGIENYVFNVVGIRFDSQSIELKSTTNSSSSISAYANSSASSELRIKREGNMFSCYSRDIGSSTWIFRNSYTRTDLPSTLQIGLIAYSYLAYPENLLAKFDYIRFSEPTLSTSELNNKEKQLYFYPNPAENSLTIKMGDSKLDSCIIHIYDVLGKEVLRKMFNSFNEDEIKLNISNFDPGLYQLKISTKEGLSAMNFKIIKR